MPAMLGETMDGTKSWTTEAKSPQWQVMRRISVNKGSIQPQCMGHLLCVVCVQGCHLKEPTKVWGRGFMLRIIKIAFPVSAYMLFVMTGGS